MRRKNCIIIITSCESIEYSGKMDSRENFLFPKDFLELFFTVLLIKILNFFLYEKF